jgi:hypothetical protein
MCIRVSFTYTHWQALYAIQNSGIKYSPIDLPLVHVYPLVWMKVATRSKDTQLPVGGAILKPSRVGR